MKKLVLCISTLALLAIACQKLENNVPLNGDEMAPAVKMITETISGSRGVETKATIADADASFKWSIDDNVAVHVSNGSSHKYVVTTKGASKAAASASFTVEYEDGYSRDAYAIYPSYIVAPTAANYGQKGYKLDVTLPSSYTLDQVSGETSPCPMIARNTSGEGWVFYQICSLLRLTVNDIPAATKRLEITISGCDGWVHGSFQISKVTNGYINPESAFLRKFSNGGTGGNTITITKDGSNTTFGSESLVINLPLPLSSSSNKYSEISVRAYNALSGGDAIVSASIPFTYLANKTKAVKRTVSFAASMAFRGYEVSTGILERSSLGYSLTSGAMELVSTNPDTGERTYKLPNGCNPFEPAIYYGNNDNKDVYFHKWLTLQSELGADGYNIKANSEYLPKGWYFPTGGSDASDWGKILFGAPKSPIVVNGATVGTGNAYALVAVTLESGNSYGVSEGTYYGMFLLRDGTTIPNDYLTKVGKALYTDNPLDVEKFNYLIQKGCLFISASGHFDGNQNSWRDLSASWQYGYYWSSTYKTANTNFYLLRFYNATSAPVVNNSDQYDTKNYSVVKLVKPL